ncbi:methylmalonyl Co-A mutase-associated GTPase MeaB [Fodinicurvata halophila]|uniref:Methylmalonyl Co-A mutase-associated GTPase MeaB n=1 Tax=Fodinicurvata halophila TaxID=1419723 RepID=A0ABV8UMU4_9PROT
MTSAQSSPETTPNQTIDDPQLVKLAEQLRGGSRRALGRAITLVESTRLDDRARAEELLQLLLPETGNSVRIGISGVPGVGKSTFIEAFGLHLIDQGHRVAVLAVDPSSRRTGGSILGDKTRMELLSRAPEAFIRPSPTGHSLGGVARRTREVMLLCEAAGYDHLLVETVGVGQSETAVAEMVDLFLLLLVPGGGDELQGLKKGIVELANLVVVNKADGELKEAAQRAVAEYKSALRMLRPLSDSWQVPVLSCSALEKTGFETVLQGITDHLEALGSEGLTAKRNAQARAWMWNEIDEELRAAFRNDSRVAALLEQAEAEVTQGRLPPGRAAQDLLQVFLDSSTRKDPQ